MLQNINKTKLYLCEFYGLLSYCQFNGIRRELLSVSFHERHRSKMLFLFLLKGIIHKSALTAVISKASGAVDQILFTEWNEFSCFLEVLSFQWSSCTKCPARTTLAWEKWQKIQTLLKRKCTKWKWKQKRLRGRRGQRNRKRRKKNKNEKNAKDKQESKRGKKGKRRKRKRRRRRRWWWG